METAAKLPRWSSKATFLLASMGCTIGLGNIWRFPFVAGENGGGAFLVIYVAALLTISIPVMIAELFIGHTGRGDPVNAIGNVARKYGLSLRWNSIGYVMALLGLIYLFYYPIIGSWALHYVQLSFSGALQATSEEQLPLLFDRLMENGTALLTLHTLFMAAAAMVTALGFRNGLEALAKYLMPLLLIILVGLTVYAAIGFGLGAGASFLFTPDFSAIDENVALAAIGQALFSTAVGQGVLMVYAGYLDEDVRLPGYSGFICLADATVAIVAGIFIFSVAAYFQLPASSGEGLVYQAMPLAFVDMAGGTLVAGAFFTLLALAAFTSVIPTIELLARFCEAKFKMRHAHAAIMIGFIAWLGGLTVIWSQLNPDAAPSLLRLYDYVVSNILIPVAALMMAIFVGWRVRSASLPADLNFRSALLFQIWRICLRYVAPLAIIGVFVGNL